MAEKIAMIINPPTTKLFRPTFTAKRGWQPPWIFDFPTAFLCEIIHGYVLGVKESNVIVKIFYLYRVTLKLKIIALVHGSGATPWSSPSRS